VAAVSLKNDQNGIAVHRRLQARANLTGTA
jgi:hypothetical protein